MKFDMHFHSTLSDGRNTPNEILENIWDSWLSLVALTDHDTISGDEFVSEAKQSGIHSNPAVEISAMDYELWKSLHLTCYAQQFEQEVYDILNNTVAKKREMILAQVSKLAHNWFLINGEELYDYFEKGGKDINTLNKFNIAEYLFQNPENEKIIPTLVWENFSLEGFYLNFLKEGGKYYEKYGERIDEYEPSIEVCWAMAQTNNAILAIAHPQFSFSRFWIHIFQDDILPRYVDAWINAIEVHSKTPKSWLKAIYEAKEKYNLILTAGSDNHWLWHSDSKHTLLWEINPYLSEDQQEEILREYMRFLER